MKYSQNTENFGVELKVKLNKEVINQVIIMKNT